MAHALQLGVRNVLGGGAQAEKIQSGLSHYSPPHETIAPHYSIITMFFWGAIVYLTTKLGGSNGKDPKIQLKSTVLDLSVSKFTWHIF